MTGPSVPVEGSASRFLPLRLLQLWSRPKRTWAAIGAEPTSVGELYVGVVMPLSALIPLRMIIQAAAGSRPAWPLIEQWLLTYVLGLVALYSVAILVNRWAPKYGGHQGIVSSLKVLAYSGSLYWVLGGILPMKTSSFVGMMAFAGIWYGVYLLAVGLRVVLGADRQVGRYAVLVSVVTLVAFGVIAQGIPATIVAPSTSITSAGVLSLDSGMMMPPSGARLHKKGH